MKGFLENLIPSGRVVGVGLSGGKDSVALLTYLKEREHALGIRVVAVTVEHGIRGESSVSDRDFCLELCKDLSVPVRAFSVDAIGFSRENGYTVEQAARILRYQSFFKAITGGFCDVVATAHHESDSVETVLFNLFRGTALSGVCGIDPVAFDGRIIRPMVKVAKTDLLAYVLEKNLKFREDETNLDTGFSRNYIRSRIIPVIEEKFPTAQRGVERFSSLARGDDQYLYSLAEKTAVIARGEGKIPCDAPYPIFSRCAVLIFKALGATKDFDNSHIDGLFALTANQTGKRVSLLKGLYGVREHDFIVIRRQAEKKAEGCEFSLGAFDFKMGLVEFSLSSEFAPKKGELYFDLDAVPAGAVIRNLAVGDKFTKFDGKTVSLKKFLTDKKLPASQKAVQMVVAKDDKIYIIPGVEISATVKVTEKTTRIAKVTTTKEKAYGKINV